MSMSTGRGEVTRGDAVSLLPPQLEKLFLEGELAQLAF